MDDKKPVYFINIYEYNKYRRCKRKPTYEIECPNTVALDRLYDAIVLGKKTGYIKFNAMFIMPVENFAKAVIVEK